MNLSRKNLYNLLVVQIKRLPAVLTLLLLGIALAILLREPGHQYPAKVCFRDGVCVNADIANTKENMTRGLMNRTEMPGDYGMLFVFPDEGDYVFWMKNTLIPLDIIWINSSKHIVHMEYAVPCIKDPCRIYRPDAKSVYVLEVNGRYAMKNNIAEGQKVEIYLLQPLSPINGTNTQPP